MHQTDPTFDPARATPFGSLETREVRWFAAGPLPGEVAEWFKSNGRATSVERRIDSYLLNGRHDLGVKRRGRTLLEVKRRTATLGTVRLAGMSAGRMERWTKAWRPDVNETPSGSWVDVEKLVLTEKHVLEAREGVGTCEVEIASVDAVGVSVWTLAFESDGPESLRSLVLDQAMEIFASESRRPAPFNQLTYSAGYPEWLDSMDFEALSRATTEGQLHPA